MDWLQLPKPALIHTFELLPLTYRLVAAQACTDWADAAAATTQKIVCSRCCASHGSLQEQLQQLGSTLDVLHLRHVDLPLVALPCPRLQDLLLECCLLQLVQPLSSILSDLEAATRLRSLQLIRCTLITGNSSADPLAALTALRNLQHLTLLPELRTAAPSSRVYDSQAIQTVPGTLLEALPHLTHLCIRDMVALVTPQQLAALTGLQLLELQLQLPEGNARDPTAGAASEAATATDWGLPQLTALQQLKLSAAGWRVAFDPTALAGLTGLRQLHLSRLSFCTTCGTPAAPAAAAEAAAEAAGAAALLQALLGMHQLTDLSLPDLILPGQPAEAWAALTTSSRLQRLSLLGCASTVDSSAWQAVFRRGLQLPHLTQLQLLLESPRMDTQAVRSCARCCPNLQQLILQELHWPWMDPAPLKCPDDYGALLGLKQLTKLSISGADDTACTEVLPRMTQLRCLELVAVWHVLDDAAVRCLTALTGLTLLMFVIAHYGVSPELRAELELRCPHPYGSQDGWDRYNLTIAKPEPPPGFPPDVCYQLEDVCDAAAQARAAWQAEAWPE